MEFKVYVKPSQEEPFFKDDVDFPTIRQNSKIKLPFYDKLNSRIRRSVDESTASHGLPLNQMQTLNVSSSYERVDKLNDSDMVYGFKAYPAKPVLRKNRDVNIKLSTNFYS